VMRDVRRHMEPPAWSIVLFAAVFAVLAIFIYLGGTLFILVASAIPARTRLRWAGVSVLPLAVMVVGVIVLRFFSSDASNADDEAPLVSGIIAAPLIIAAIVGNWFTYRKFRAVYGSSKS
jgi:hypothetical protein